MKLNRREDHYSLTFYAPKLCLPLPQTFRSNSAAFSYLRLPCSSGFYEQRLFFQHCTALVISNFAHFRVAFFRSVPLAGNPGVSGNSRSRPFPGIPASHSRSRKLGMIFSFPFPFPKVGNAIFHSRSRSQNLGMQFSIPVPVTGNGLSKSGIRTGIEFKRWEKEGF